MGATPIKSGELINYLNIYPNKQDANILKSGFINGFKVNYSGLVESYICKNLKSATLHTNELEKKIMKEITLGRIAGPFKEPPFEKFKMSPVGLVPKNDGSWRLITHLSYP